MTPLLTLELCAATPDETRRLGHLIGKWLPRPARVFLYGEMGAGKTLLTKAIYEGMGGLEPEKVTSPTYTMVNLHDDIPQGFYHVDLYRLEKLDQLLAMEYEDFLLLNPGVTVVEWPEFAQRAVGAGNSLEIRLSVETPSLIRRFHLSTADPRYATLMTGLSDL